MPYDLHLRGTCLATQLSPFFWLCLVLHLMNNSVNYAERVGRVCGAEFSLRLGTGCIALRDSMSVSNSISEVLFDCQGIRFYLAFL